MSKKSNSVIDDNKYPELYLNSRDYAIRHGEINPWRESQTLNGKCAREIDAIMGHLDRYDAKQLDVLLKEIDSVLDQYGTARVSFVLAETVDTLRNNQNISGENRQWFDEQGFPHFSSALDTRGYILNCRVNPGLLNDFINVYRQRLEDRGKEFSPADISEEKSEFQDLHEFYETQKKYEKELRADLTRLREYAVENGYVSGDRVNFDKSKYWFQVEITDPVGGRIYPYYFSCDSLNSLKKGITWIVNETKFYDTVAFVKDRSFVTFRSQKDIEMDFDSYYQDYYRFSEDVCETYPELFDHTFTGEEMEKIYQAIIDKNEYPLFDGWLQDMCRSGLAYSCHKNYVPEKQVFESEQNEEIIRDLAETEDSCKKRRGR